MHKLRVRVRNRSFSVFFFFLNKTISLDRKQLLIWNIFLKTRTNTKHKNVSVFCSLFKKKCPSKTSFYKNIKKCLTIFTLKKKERWKTKCQVIAFKLTLKNKIFNNKKYAVDYDCRFRIGRNFSVHPRNYLNHSGWM